MVNRPPRKFPNVGSSRRVWAVFPIPSVVAQMRQNFDRRYCSCLAIYLLIMPEFFSSICGSCEQQRPNDVLYLLFGKPFCPVIGRTILSNSLKQKSVKFVLGIPRLLATGTIIERHFLEPRNLKQTLWKPNNGSFVPTGRI